MHTLTDSHAADALTQLATHFEHWRQHRSSLAEPIPEALWDQAVSLTKVLSISRVATRLRLSGRDLKKRCQANQHATPPAQGLPASLGFVDLTATPAWPMPGPSIEVELCRADGARLHMHTHVSHLPLEILVKTFLESR